jgi:hypothetical protein
MKYCVLVPLPASFLQTKVKYKIYHYKTRSSNPWKYHCNAALRFLEKKKITDNKEKRKDEFCFTTGKFIGLAVLCEW